MTVEEQTQYNYYYPYYSPSRSCLGQRLIIPGRLVTKLAFVLERGSGGSYAVYFSIYQWSNKNLIYNQYTGYTQGSLPTSPTWIEVALDTPQFINGEVGIGAWCPQPSFNDKFRFYVQDSDVKAGENHFAQYSVVWPEWTGQDAAYKYEYEEVTPPPGAKSGEMAAKMLAGRML